MRRDHAGPACVLSPVAGMAARVLRSPPLAPAGILLLLALACGDARDRAPASSGEIMTARTRGLVYLEENRLEEAEAEFARLVRMAPDETAGHANLGSIYLRLGRYAEAEEAIAQAAALAPRDADIRLLEATVYRVTDRPDRARRILHLALDIDSSHVRVRYALAEMDSARRLDHLARLADLVPANVAARVELVGALVAENALARAGDQIERLRGSLPELPAEAAGAFEALAEHVRANRPAEARETMSRVRSILATTPAYQAGMGELLGPAGAPPGYPVLSYSRQVAMDPPDPRTVVDAIRFTDATAELGLDLAPAGAATGGEAPFTQVAVGDFEDDGYADIVVSTWNAGEAAARVYLLRNDAGAFTEVAAGAGIRATDRTTATAVVDYDDDGDLDLYLANAGPDALYRNDGGGTFRDVARAARLADADGGATAVFVDLDQDGSLDLFLGAAAGDRVYRGSPDGRFRERAAAMGLAGAGARRAVFGDFDGDGRIGLIVSRADGLGYYRRTGGGRFDDATVVGGLDGAATPAAVAAGDYDNDGALDLAVLGSTGAACYRNRGDGTFERDERARAAVDALAGIEPLDATFLDFDNDGLLDLVAVGRPARGNRRGVVLLHNGGGGRFTDRSALLPDDLPGARQVLAFDPDGDGDLDLLLAGLDGPARLLRNHGGNANQFVDVRLMALRAAGARNNHFGIGARIEVRAGDLYQARTVTGPSTHFGMASRLKVDVLRIVWPSGVPQSLHFPGTDRDVLEEQGATSWGRPVPVFR